MSDTDQGDEMSEERTIVGRDDISLIVRAFIEAVYPDAPDLALATFNEKICLKDATDLIKELREERDRYKADSEALDWILKNFGITLNGMMKLAGEYAYADCSEHLRKRLEEK